MCSMSASRSPTSLWWATVWILPKTTATCATSACCRNSVNEYLQRLEQRRLGVQRFDRLHVLAGNLRLAILLIALVLIWQRQWWWLAAPVVAFVALMMWHERVLRARTRAERA